MAAVKKFNFKRFAYTKHMLERADERSIELEQIEHTIEFGDIIAEYPHDKPYPSYLSLCFFNGNPLHVCFAQLNPNECRVITAYKPSLIIFERDFKTKRTP